MVLGGVREVYDKSIEREEKCMINAIDRVWVLSVFFVDLAIFPFPYFLFRDEPVSSEFYRGQSKFFNVSWYPSGWTTKTLCYLVNSVICGLVHIGLPMFLVRSDNGGVLAQ